jgi:hypothetical protein
MNDAPAECVLWLDAGDCILRPVPEVFEIIRQQGYFAVPNYWPLEIEASEDACEGCGVPPDFRVGKTSLALGVFGFMRGSVAEKVVKECLEVALTERYIRANKPWHRWEQAILSLLMYRDISPLLLCDGTTYLYEDLAAKFTTHAIWAARRYMHKKDLRFFASCLSGPVSRHLPRSSHRANPWLKIAIQVKIALNTVLRLLGRQKDSFDGVR